MRLGHALLLAACLMAASAPARADCFPLAEYTRLLAAHYQEQPIARAIQGGVPIIVFASTAGTYTVVAIVQSGRTGCAIAAGTDWQAMVPLPGKPS